MERKEIIKSPGYWTETYRLKLHRLVLDYQQSHGNCTLSKMCTDLDIDKKRLTDFLIEDNDLLPLWDFIEMSLKLGKVPEITFTNIEGYK